MLLIESRPSIWDRITGNITLSTEERSAYLEKLIKIEEEKEMVQKFYKENQKIDEKVYRH